MRVVRRLETGAAARDQQSVTPLVLGWFLAGLAAVGILLLASPTRPAITTTFVALLLVTAVAETAAVQLQAGRSALSLSLLESAVVVSLLLLPPPSAVLAILAGIAISHTIRRMGVEKIAFNLGQHAVAATAAAAIVSLVPAAPPVSSARVAAVVVGVLVYSVVNSIALAGIFARLGLASFREQLTKRPGFLVATSIGNASVGAIAVIVWTANPSVVWIIVGPLLALYLSYGSNFRIESLLSAVSSERDHLDRVVTSVSEGIVLLDEEGVVRLWNDAMTRITGVPADEAIGQHASAVLTGIGEDGVPVDPAGVLHEQRDGSPTTVTLTTSDGQRVETRIGHTLVYDDRDRCIGDVVLVLDLSREREARSLKQDFVARVSHELRTPLTPLRGYAQVLLRSGDRIPPEKRDEVLRQMVEHAGHLERLIDDLLLVSRISSGAAQPTDEVKPQVCDLGELVPRIVKWVEQDHGGRDIRILAGDGPLLAWADPLRVGQVVTNLLTNACKYSPAETSVEVVLASAGEDLRVQVRDHGPGIPPDKRDAIFERFHRLEDPMRMRTSGLGLGLYIARSLAEAMGGRLELESERSRGSTFTFVVPRASATQLAADDPVVRQTIPA